ncbi:centromere protein K isoform X2 [Saimiri boliviensis]|uniref:centromere protein K isoform X2 n=1 Tax=Saimiri boliviensis TaxID=27679 RepID=UPI003D77141C
MLFARRKRRDTQLGYQSQSSGAVSCQRPSEFRDWPGWAGADPMGMQRAQTSRASGPRLRSAEATWRLWRCGVIPLTEDVLLTLGKEEFQKLRHDLEMVLSTMESKNEKLKEDLEREQRWLDEQQQIMESLNVLHDELKNKVETFSESRVFKELKTKLLNVKEYKEKLLSTLGEFLEGHFPLPDGSVKKKKKNIQESTIQLITLHEMLEILINRLFDVPHDPYVKISDSFWPPYVELLLRNGIALRHPEDPTRIRLEAFHQ